MLPFLAACASSGGLPVSGAPAGDAKAMLARAHKALEQGQLAAARQGFAAVAEQDGVTPAVRAVALANLGVTLTRMERDEEAVNALEAARLDAPENARIHFDLGVVYRKLGQYDKVRESYLKAAKLAPDNPDVWYNLGILYELYLEDAKAAASAYQRYIDGGGPEAERVGTWLQTLRQRQAAE